MLRRVLDPAFWRTALAMLGQILRSVADPRVWRLALRNVGRSGRRTAIVITAVAVGLSGAILTMSINYGMVHQMVETAIRTELGDLQLHGRGFKAGRVAMR